MAATKPIHFIELLKDSPKNWGRFGPNDEIGALNFLTSAEVLRGIRAVKQDRASYRNRACEVDKTESRGLAQSLHHVALQGLRSN